MPYADGSATLLLLYLLLLPQGVAAGKFIAEYQKRMSVMQLAMLTPRSLQQVLLNMHR
jgi:hypothetical protein